MWKIKFKVDTAGSVPYTKVTFKLTEKGLRGPGPVEKKVFLKLLKPKDANIKLTLTINKKTLNVAVSTGTLVTAGPFPFFAENLISFDGSSDKFDALHEIDMTPQLLK